MLLIDKIEGNSGIGVPVFSRFGQMQNYNFLVMSPNKKPKLADANDSNNMISEEHEKFRFTKSKNKD
jgi:hypothetical protein